ncbi:hypothetical protein, partial [Methanocalculus natronophilus]|uniref:hypothetical protein n=1 Tax=Methanocalculus natronophilus TaxID=1262400 RepID=UPI0031B5B133
DACSKVIYQIEYQSLDLNGESDEVFRAYYGFALDLLTEQKPRFHALSSMEVEQSKDTLQIVCPKDGTYVEEMLFDIEKILFKFGFDIKIRVRYCDDAPTISEAMEETIKEEKVEEIKEKPLVFSGFKDQSVKTVKHEISDIPINEETLNEYKSEHHNANFSIQGVIE